MAKLAAASDVSSYAALNVNSIGNEVPEIVPLDDESTVNRMRETYREMGLDPNLANNHDDPLADFGGTYSLM